MNEHKISLIAKGYKPNNQGVRTAITQGREVWAEEESIQQSEHAAAGQSGYKSEARVSVWDFEYEGEKTARYRGRTLEIYRTFHRHRDGRVELYLGERMARQ